MISTLIAVIVVCALAAIAAEWNGRESRHRSFYVLKPLTTLLILALAAMFEAHVAPGYRHAVMLALIFCAVGDACLMFEGERWFLAGLSSFLVGHALFIVAFLQGLPGFAPPWWSLAWAAVVVPVAIRVLPRAGALKVPVLVYMLVIGAMTLTALARYSAFGDTPALRALAGATLFMLSDASLAVRQFLGPYRYAQPLILSTYWLAIGLIACSV